MVAIAEREDTPSLGIITDFDLDMANRRSGYEDVDAVDTEFFRVSPSPLIEELIPFAALCLALRPCRGVLESLYHDIDVMPALNIPQDLVCLANCLGGEEPSIVLDLRHDSKGWAGRKQPPSQGEWDNSR